MQRISRSVLPTCSSEALLIHSRIIRRRLHQSIDNTPQALFEEQLLPRYYQKRYLPVEIGQVIHGRYRILAKLGYGAYSTVWLARDQHTKQYMALKAFVRDDAKASPVHNELRILRHIRSCPDDAEAVDGIALPDDIFEIDGHQCAVRKPHACSLQDLQDIFSGRIPREFLFPIIARMLGVNNWLQLDCGVVHTEITPQNILLTAQNETMFQRIEQEEMNDASIPLVDESHPYPHPIYPSRAKPGSLLEAWGDPRLSDFGSAQLLEATASTEGWWMPDTYRAPEILMGRPWGHPVDMWAIGVMILELFEGKNVFNPRDKVRQQYVLPLALAQYIGYMGLPPLSMIQGSSNPAIPTFFDKKGNWAVEELPITATSCEDFVTVIPPGEEKTKFLDFIKSIFTWDPAKRANSYDLLTHEWMETSRVRIQEMAASIPPC